LSDPLTGGTSWRVHKQGQGGRRWGQGHAALGWRRCMRWGCHMCSLLQ